MDQERYEREKPTFKHFQYPSKNDEKFFNYRLIQEDEVPPWVKVNVKKKEVAQEYEKGFRTKKQVSYVDDMNETQWLKMLEDGLGQPTEGNGNDSSATNNISTDKEEYKAAVGRPRRTRTRAQAEIVTVKEEEKDTRRRTLRKRTTVMKLQDLSEKEEEEEDVMEEEDSSKNDEFDIEEAREIDDKRYRRLKKTKRNNDSQNNLLEKKEEEEEDGVKEEAVETVETMQIELQAGYRLLDQN